MTALDPRADLSAAPARHGRGPWFVVGQYVALKGADHERWLTGMRRLVRAAREAQ